MSAVVPFTFRDGEQLRTLPDGDSYWFVAADVAAILGYDQTASMTRLLDDEDKGVQIVHTLGGPQSMAVISEPGLYAACLRRQAGYVSDPDARETVKAFQRWVTHEVLPTIRRTGSYVTPAYKLPETFGEALRMLADTVEAKEASDAALAIAAPKADAFDHFLAGDRDYSVGAAAKLLAEEGYDIGERRLFAELADRKWLFRRENHWHLMQRIVDAGYGRMRASTATFIRSDGSIGTGAPQVRITARGLDAIRRLHTKTLKAVPS